MPRSTPTSPSTPPAAGTSELKQTICARYQKDYGVDYKPSEVIVTAGGKQALYNVAVALFGRGDEVITHAPCWPTLLEQVKLADASPVVVQTYADDGFAITAETILNAVTPATRAIIINSPCNPTGALMTRRARSADRRNRDLEHLRHPRSLLRAVDLRADSAQSAEAAGDATARSRDPVRLGVEVLCDDRMALRLGARAR